MFLNSILTPVRYLPVVARRLLMAVLVAVLSNFGMTGAQISEINLHSADIGSKVELNLDVGESWTLNLPTSVADVALGNPRIVNVVMRTNKRAFIVSSGIGSTNVQFLDAKGQAIIEMLVQVGPNVTEMEKLIHRFVPRTDIDFALVRGNLIMSGTVAQPEDVGKVEEIARMYIGEGATVINNLNIRVKDQVALKVTIAEVQRTALKNLKADLPKQSPRWASTTNVSSAISSATSLGLGGSAGNGLSLAMALGNDLRFTMSALEQSGLVKILADTTLTASSGEPANFLAGGEFPVPTMGENGLAYSYRSFGVSLGFTPVVVSENLISLKLSTEVSELGSVGATQNGVSLPNITVNRAESTLEMSSGASMVIAGLIKETTKQNIGGVPGLKDLPVLGALFRSREFQRNESELVIMITPYLVQPTHPSKLSRPDQGLVESGDFDGAILGKFNTPTKARNANQPSTFYGSVGFISR